MYRYQIHHRCNIKQRRVQPQMVRRRLAIQKIPVVKHTAKHIIGTVQIGCAEVIIHCQISLKCPEVKCPIHLAFIAMKAMNHNANKCINRKVSATTNEWKLANSFNN